jgi:hypothetical protein
MGLCKKRDALAAYEKALFGGFFLSRGEQIASRCVSSKQKESLEPWLPKTLKS